MTEKIYTETESHTLFSNIQVGINHYSKKKRMSKNGLKCNYICNF